MLMMLLRSEVLKCIHMFEVFFVVVARCCYFVVFRFVFNIAHNCKNITKILHLVERKPQHREGESERDKTYTQTQKNHTNIYI